MILIPNTMSSVHLDSEAICFDASLEPLPSAVVPQRPVMCSNS